MSSHRQRFAAFTRGGEHQRFNRRLRYFVVGATPILVFLALAGCGGDSSTDSTEPVASVIVTPDPASVQVGGTVQLTAALEDAAGTPSRGAR
jgi:hypothetical protein